jgi:hypothetical protein
LLLEFELLLELELLLEFELLFEFELLLEFELLFELELLLEFELLLELELLLEFELLFELEFEFELLFELEFEFEFDDPPSSSSRDCARNCVSRSRRFSASFCACSAQKARQRSPKPSSAAAWPGSIAPERRVVTRNVFNRVIVAFHLQ